MDGFSYFEAVHRLSIAGMVVDPETGRPIAGARVLIESAPPALAPAGAETTTDADGSFRFIDLPDGAYTLSFSIPGGGRRYGMIRRDFTVPSDLVTTDGEGRPTMKIPLVALPSTGVRGQILGAEKTPLPMARVRVRGSGERAYGDAEGRFYLPSIEPGRRTLEISAPGYEPASATIDVIEGETAELSPLELVLSSS